MSMDWEVPVSTMLGATIGVGATLLADHLRWRRSRTQSWEQTRRELYAEFLAGVMQAHGAIRAAAYPSELDTKDLQSRNIAAQEAFRTSGIYEKRHRLALIAPRPVVEAANDVFYVLVKIRDTLQDGHHIETEEYRERVQPLRRATDHLRDVMRVDLGVEPLREDD